MPVERQRDLHAFLREFVETHRGLRAGMMFGLPAAFAGRRVFARVVKTGIAYRVPADLVRGPASRRSRKMGRTNWVTCRPRTRASLERLIPLLERSARHVALTSRRSL